MMKNMIRRKLMFVLSFGLFCHATGMESETVATEKNIPPDEFVSEWSSLFAGATNLVSKEGAGRFAKLLMKQLAKKDAGEKYASRMFFHSTMFQLLIAQIHRQTAQRRE